MVDGLVVKPPPEPSLLSVGGDHPYGLVINLRGPYAPVRLSVDRAQVLDGLPAGTSGLIDQAARALVVDPVRFVSFDWLARVVRGSPQLADAIAQVFADAGMSMRREGVSVDLRSMGVFDPDADLAALFLPGRRTGRTGRPVDMPNHLFLWRILAHGSSELRDELVRLVPEVSDLAGLLRACPSDRNLSTDGGHTPGALSAVYGHARRTGRDPYEVALRARALGAIDKDPAGFLHAGSCSFRQEAALLEAADGGRAPSDGSIRTADLVRVHHALGVGLVEAAARLRRYGFDVPNGPQGEDLLTQETLRLLSTDQTIKRGNWLDLDEAIPPGHVLQAASTLKLEAVDIVRRLEALGGRVESLRSPVEPDEDLLRLLSRDLDGQWPWLSMASTVPPGHLLAAADEFGVAAESVAESLSALGFRVLPLPERREPQDREILGRPDLHGGDQVFPDVPIPFAQLISVVADSDVSHAVAVDRLAAYGILTGLTFPEEPEDLDRALLSEGVSWFAGVSVGQVVPLNRVLVTAGEFGVSLGEITSRLATYGVPLSRAELPQGLDPYRAVLLGNVDKDTAASLPDLVLASRQAQMSLAETAHWLRELGVDVPDVAEMIRAALARVPREIPSVRP
ncbi:hypothetical protein ATKI12_3113 [Kitasatospora sp. Ki12]